MAGGMHKKGLGIPLAQRPVAPAPGAPTPAARARHCWISYSDRERAAGLVVTWRRRDHHGWEALVVHTRESPETGDPVIVTEWLPSDQLIPA